MDKFLYDVLVDVVATVCASPIVFVLGAVSYQVWERLPFSNKPGAERNQGLKLEWQEVVFLLAFAAIMGGVYMISLALYLSWSQAFSRLGMIGAAVFYVTLSTVIGFVIQNILSAFKNELDVSSDSRTLARSRVYVQTTLVKIAAFVLFIGFALFITANMSDDLMASGLFMLFIIDIMGAMIMLLVD